MSVKPTATLLTLPTELISRIFTLSSNPSLVLTCRVLNQTLAPLSKTVYTRIEFLLYRYRNNYIKAVVKGLRWSFFDLDLLQGLDRIYARERVRIRDAHTKESLNSLAIAKYSNNSSRSSSVVSTPLMSSVPPSPSPSTTSTNSVARSNPGHPSDRPKKKSRKYQLPDESHTVINDQILMDGISTSTGTNGSTNSTNSDLIPLPKDFSMPRRLFKSHKYFELIKTLIARGASSSQPSNYPLVRASQRGDVEMVKLLLVNGAPPDQKALRWACVEEQDAVLDLFVEMGFMPDETCLDCSVAGSLYPAYASFKAINTRDNNRLTAWLMYWSVMGLFSIAEFVLDTFIFWFPFYYEIKLLFVLWMILPQTQGSIYLYQVFVDPYLTQHEHEIDQTLKNLQKQAKAMGMQYVKQGIQLLQNLVLDIYRKSLGQSDLSAQSVKDAHDQQPTHESTSSQARSTSAGQHQQERQDQPPQGYFSWAYNVVSPKLSAVATMASQSISRQIPARPLPQPPVNLYSNRTASSSSTSRDGSISTTLGDNAFGITTAGSDPGSATLSSAAEKIIFNQLSSRLNKASQSTGVGAPGAEGSMRHRKISLYDDDVDESPVPAHVPASSSSTSVHAKDSSWSSYASGFGRRSSAAQE
ncbi:hypothetical protein MVEG_00602 [Podila verticillata NRRL 6337]|nr:hypothetical protein MVEG_00602 [Podila verticillata NRRL 6337]